MTQVKKAVSGLSETRVSVIIPTLNGGERFREMLIALKNQTLVPDEIFVVDSASTDDTLDTARSFHLTVRSIKRSEFDHGGTRTQAAGLTKGDILVYMTQDAVPASRDSLEKLIAPLTEKRIAASYGRQLPASDASCFARHLRSFNYPEQSTIRCWEDKDVYGFKTAFISNSFAAYQRNALEEIGFFDDGLLFGEDSLTLAKLLRKGYCVSYAAGAMVYHSHNYSVSQDFRRYFDIGVFHAVHAELIEQFGSPSGEGKRYVRSELRHLLDEGEYIRIPESILRNCMKFLAYNLGKRYTVLPHWLAVGCSLNRQWWAQNKSDL